MFFLQPKFSDHPRSYANHSTIKLFLNDDDDEIEMYESEIKWLNAGIKKF